MAVTSEQINIARKAGYSDDEIVQHLSTSEPSMKQAISAGYSPSEIMAHFDQKPAKISTGGNPDASPAQTERMRREFVAKTAKPETRIKEFARTVFDPTQQTAPADSVADFATRVLPESATKLIPRIAHAGYEAIKGQVQPMARSLSTLQPTGLPGREMEANARGTLTNLAQAVTAPTGLMGLEAAKNAWTTDPVGSALAVAPTVKVARGGLSNLKSGVSAAADSVTPIFNKPAEKLMDMTLKQPTTLKPGIRDQNLKTALEGGYLPNAKGVQRLGSDISAAETAISEGIKSGDAASVRGTLDRSISNVEKLREQANRSDNPAKNNALIDAELERLRTNPMQEADNAIPIGEMQKMKVEQGRNVKYQQKTGQAVDPFQATIDKARIRGMKEELEARLFEVFPELAETNKGLGQKYQLQDVLERAASRIENNQGIGIGLPIKSGSGAAMGGMIGGAPGAAIGAGIGTLIGIIEHPSVAPRLANMLYRSQKGKISSKQAQKITKQRLMGIRSNIQETDNQ